VSGKPGRAAEHTQEIVRRYGAGESIRFIAAELLLSYGGVHRVLAVAGVEFRSTGKPRAGSGVKTAQRATGGVCARL
jgi:hypothetical protein